MKLQFEVTRLESGLRVVTAAMPHVESVAMGVWVSVGGRHENRRQSGISHFIEHLLFKGTMSRSAREISQAIEGRGGYFNAFTQEESTCYYARIAADHTWEVFDILGDMYRHPRFAAADIEKERGVIIEEIMMYNDQPQHLVQEMLGQLLWVDHPLGRPLTGTAANVARIQRPEIVAYKQRRYVPEATIVVLAGQVAHGECVSSVARMLGRLSAGRPARYAPVDRRTRQLPVAVKLKEIEQSHLAMGFRLFGRHDPRKYALKLMSIIMGENMSSRLFQVVREKHGLAYSIHSSVELFGETGLLHIQAGIDKERTSQALELILREVRKFRERPVGASELRRAKDYAIGQLRIGLESTTNQMMWAGENIMCYGRFIQPDEVIQRLQAVGAADIQAVAAAVLRPERFSLAMVAPTGGGRDENMLRARIGLLK